MDFVTSQCSQKLWTLIKLVNTLTFPYMTRSQRDTCKCSICVLAGKNAGQPGYVGEDKPFKLGRPKIPIVKMLSTPRPILRCKRCLGLYGKGIPHPQPCGLEQRRKVIAEIMLQDPEGWEMSAASILSRKANAENKSDTIQLKSNHHKDINIAIPGPSRRRTLFRDKPIPASEVQKLMTLNKMSLKDVR